MTETNTMTNDIFATSTWSTLSEPGTIGDADAFIASAETKGHWPVKVDACEVSATMPSGLVIPATKNVAIVGTYADGKSKVLGMNGSRYNATTAEQWRDLVRAAVAAGARPTGSHAWDGKVIAQFDIGGNGTRTNLVLGDSFDGSCKLMAGTTVIRLACANALSVTAGRRGSDWSKIRHTSSLEEKINRLAAGIAEAAASGADVQELFELACKVVLTPAAAKVAFDKLFPLAADDAKAAAKTKAENARTDARAAAAMSINRIGTSSGNLGTLWNASTYLVDRKADGSSRGTRGGSMVASMLFGSRAKRVQEIQTLVEVVMANGETHSMTVTDALNVGADAEQMGAGLLADMLSDLN